ncbi:hypothetical protein B0H19DRAFT_1277332 [Mycena capillaripes]|nr:hypothetical protein B0H19DRAFT_1277332 [Mycena capillaripes]
MGDTRGPPAFGLIDVVLLPSVSQHQQLGPSALAGFSLFLFIVPIQERIMAVQFKTSGKSMKFTDLRARILLEEFTTSAPTNIAVAFSLPILTSTLAFVAYTRVTSGFDIALKGLTTFKTTPRAAGRGASGFFWVVTCTNRNPPSTRTAIPSASVSLVGPSFYLVAHEVKVYDAVGFRCACSPKSRPAHSNPAIPPPENVEHQRQRHGDGDIPRINEPPRTTFPAHFPIASSPHSDPQRHGAMELQDL